MIPEFKKLTPEENELMLKAPILVCILIAGADGTIDRKEIHGAIALARDKQRKERGVLSTYYQIMGEDFEDKLKIAIQKYPVEATQRTPLVVEDLSKVNAIFPKIDPGFATEFYRSILDIAGKIATSSGGVLGMKSVGQEEAKYVGLPMIQDPSRLNA
jgi:hypothetical protein